VIREVVERRQQPSKRTRGVWLWRASAVAVSAGALAGAWGLATAQSPAPRLAGVVRSLTLDETLLETVRIESRFQAWILRKVCIDGQVYWIGFSEASPTAMSPSFRDGKPETCGRRPG